MIQFLELKPGYEELQEEFDQAYRRVMESGYYLLGNEIAAFESEFAGYCGSRHCIAVGSGLDALFFSLLAYEIGPGDEVLVPAQTFIATWNAVSFTGATPVPVDVSLTDGNIDPEKIEAAITNKTRGIIPVDLFGIPCRMNQIKEIAQKQNLVIVEDAAQAHSATRNGVHCGQDTETAAFSFYPGKNLGAFGDGGGVITDSDEIARKIRMLRNYGAEKKYHHVMTGFNSRLDELQSAFLRVKLAKLDQWHERRIEQAKIYMSNLADIPNLSLAQIPEGFGSSWHLFPVFTERRQQLQGFLESKQIKTLRHYPIAPAFARAFEHLAHTPKDFPNAAIMACNELSLPMGPHLSVKEVETVCNAVCEFFENE